MPYCAILDCKNHSRTKNLTHGGVSYHRFPNDPICKEIWINATGRLSWFPTNNSTICSQHFKEDDFIIKKSGNRYLKDNTKPTKNILNRIYLGLGHADANYNVEDTPGTSTQNVGLGHADANYNVEDTPGTSTQNVTEDFSPSGNEFKVFCPKCNTEVQHTAEGIQEDQTKILVAKVYHYLELEYEEMKKLYGDLDLTPLSKFRQRTALATGVSETTVLQILKEEERRNAEKRQETKGSRARKRSIQMESSSEEESSDDNVGDDGQSSYKQDAQNEAEIETLVVKLEPECDKEEVQINTFSEQVKAEPPQDDVNYTSETLALTEPAATKRKGRKIPRSDVTSNRQDTQGESSTAAASSSVRLMDVLDESGLLEETEVKEEEIDIEEGFS